jgi:hypothetical protein
VAIEVEQRRLIDPSHELAELGCRCRPG